MYQRCFGNTSGTLFVAGRTPRLSRFALSDDPRWESRHHVHDNETELIYVKGGIIGFTIDSSLYAIHAGDIVMIERDKLHATASDISGPAMTYTYVLCDFQLQGVEENQLLQSHSCPIVTTGQGKEVTKTLSNELSVILPQSENSQMSSLWGAFICVLAVLCRENFKNVYYLGQEYVKKNALIKGTLLYLNNSHRERVTPEQLSEKSRANVSCICREFTKGYRAPPINYIIQRRTTEAKWSLINTELPQVGVSQHVDYESVDHFTKLLLCRIGCSPSDYRKQFKNCFAEQEILSESPQSVGLAG